MTDSVNLRRLAAFFFLVALLAGCAAPPKRPVPADPHAAWEAHRLLLSHVTHWRLNASLAVRAGEDGGQATMDWRQRATDYDIRLSGPLGASGVRLSGDDAGATLRLGNGERLSDPDPARLLYDQLGWWIPVDSLRYWAVGLPDPALPAEWSLDEYGRLASLAQDGWEVRFEGYDRTGDLDLPKRVTIVGHEAEVRMVARRWHIDVAQAQ